MPLSIVALVIGCGGEPMPAAQPPAPPEAPPAASAAPPEPSASAAEAPTPAASASASASASAEPPKPQSSGRPAVLKSDPAEITDSFGSSPGAKLELGGSAEIATLKIPEGTLAQLTNLTFKLDTKGRSSGALAGKIYRLTPVLPPDGKPVTVASNSGTPFELTLPTGGKKPLNLAIGKIETDSAGREKITWQVIAPKRIDEGAGLALFDLPELPDGYIHLTTKPPTEATKK